MSNDFLDYDLLEIEAILRMGQEGFVSVEPDYGSDEIFHDDFNRRAREIQRQPNDLKPVHIVPQKNGPWSGNNQLGILQLFAPDNNNQQTILKLDEWGFPEVWTVMLGLEATQDAGGGAGFSVEALVNIGAGGTQQEVLMDWKQGVTFRAPMNAINVIAKFNNVAAIPDNLKLRVTVGRGSLGNGAQPPTLTRRFSCGAAASSGLIPIPAFASSFQLIGVAGVIYDVANTVFYHDFSNIALPTRSLLASDLRTNFGYGAPIYNGARFLSYNNTLGALGGDFIFNLAL